MLRFSLLTSLLLSVSLINANVSLKMSASTQWEGLHVDIFCDSNDVPTLSSLAQVRFFSSAPNRISFTLQRFCNNNTYMVTEDTTSGRIALRSSSEKVLRWSNLKYNDGDSAYKCALKACNSDTEVVSSNGVMFYVTTDTGFPEMSQPTANLAAFENVTTRFNFTCEGCVGYPGGYLYLEKATPTLSGAYKLDNLRLFTKDQNGCGKGDHSYAYAYKRDEAFSYFTCVTYNEVPTSYSYKQTRKIYVDVQYPPDYITYSTSDSTVQFNPAADGFQIDAVVPFHVVLSCNAKASPKPSFNLVVVQGPSNGIDYYGDNATLHVDIAAINESLVVLRFRCDALYQATVAPVTKRLQSYLTLNLYSSLTSPSPILTTSNTGYSMHSKVFLSSVLPILVSLLINRL